MARLYRVRNRRQWLATLLLLPFLAGCFGSAGTESEAAGPTDDPVAAETTDESASGASEVCGRTTPETIGRVLHLEPGGPAESLDGDPNVLLGAPRGLLTFTGCSYPIKSPELDSGSPLQVNVFVADGGPDDFAKVRDAATVKLTPVPDLGDEAFLAMTLQTLVYVRTGDRIVVAGYLVQNEENTIKIAREVVSGL